MHLPRSLALKNFYLIAVVLLSIFAANISFGSHVEEKHSWKDGYQIDNQEFNDDFDVAEFNPSEKKFWKILYDYRIKILTGAVFVAAIVVGVYCYNAAHINNCGIRRNFEDESIPVPETIPTSMQQTENKNVTTLPRHENQILESCKDQIAYMEEPNAHMSTDPVRIEQDLEFHHGAAFDALSDAIKKFGEDYQWEQEQFHKLDGRAQAQVQTIEELRTACDRERTLAERYSDNPRYLRRLIRAQASLESAQSEADEIAPLLHQIKANISGYHILETEALAKLQEIGDVGLARGYDMNIRIPSPVFSIDQTG